MARLGPRAPGTVEAVGLVQRPQRRQCPARAHVSDAPAERHRDRRGPGGPTLGRFDGAGELLGRVSDRHHDRVYEPTVAPPECNSATATVRGRDVRSVRLCPMTSSIDSLPINTLQGDVDVARRFRRQGDPRRQCRVEVRADPAVHRPRSAARAVQGPWLHGGRIPVQPVRCARSPARPRRSRRSVRPPTASRSR